jgi:hypothetical protein
MTLLKGFARPGAVTALFAVLLSVALAVGSTTYAQGPPHRVYGTGQTAGDTITVSIGGVECGELTADSSGNWGPLDIESSNACAPASGSVINFAVNGEAATEAGAWASGGSPPSDGFSAATGYGAAGGGLTVAAAAAAAAPAATAAPAPAPPATGNAGMATAAGSSLWLVLGMGALALGLLAAGRTVISSLKS